MPEMSGLIGIYQSNLQASIEVKRAFDTGISGVWEEDKWYFEKEKNGDMAFRYAV